MAKMRVHELAKEFGMDSKEFTDRLIEMKVPVKNHASTLEDAYIDRIRKKLGPEMAERAAAAEAERIAEEASKAAEEQAAREAEEASRKAAVEEERKRREEEKAARDLQNVEEADSVDEADSLEAATDGEPKGVQPAKKRPPERFAGLQAQIDAENKRLAAEKAEKAAARLAARGTKAAAGGGAKAAAGGGATGRGAGGASSADMGAVDGIGAGAGAGASGAGLGAPGLGSGASGAGSASTGAGTDAATASGSGSGSGAGAVAKSAADGGVAGKASASATPTTEASGATSRGRGRKTDGGAARQDGEEGGRGKRGKGKGHTGRGRDTGLEVLDIYGTEDEEAAEVDRYRKMAEVAEQIQRDRVLADARAAVAAATGEGEGRRQKRKQKRESEAREKAEIAAIEKGIDPDLLFDESVLQVTTGVTVQEFADALKVPANDIVKRLFLLGTPLTVTQTMTDEFVELIADDMGRKLRIISPEEEYAVHDVDAPADLLPRPPVVTVMGHVDHGKTSLLDAIRETGVVATEAGGITQHIGASVVEIKDHRITFIDTPGHEAFTAMRARGAKVTDVVVLVVAADDGVMPQTVEAIHHAEAAGVPIVVAVNKIDKPGANPERVRQELTEHNIVPEEWGGQNMFVEVSAKQRTGIDELLETILLQADVLELKANPNALASGFVIEAKLDKGRGPVATVLVQRGTLKGGDVVVVGSSHGRVRALVDPKGNTVSKALPADPVEILGLDSVPDAGDEFRVFADEREARNLAEDRALRKRLAEQQQKSHATLEDLFARIGEGVSDLNLVVKADVQGSIEALQDALDKMDQSEVHINVIHSAVGGITETDVALAAASDAIVIGFNVRPQPKARQLAEKEKVEVKLYRVIYQAIDDINAARVGLLKPEIVEQDTGIAEVRELFKVPKVGTIAGCFVIEGEVGRDDRLRVVRDGTIVFEGGIASLRRFKEDVKSVKSGYECGIGITGFQDVKVGDTLEGYVVREVARES
ncbi:MAG: translation initiation factor IF-2 [Coriobacteriales bacterium]|jgi:translation initiation factor IF-2|nr:translation initiation factor IF-2 [Coriobacteriales bacterium]